MKVIQKKKTWYGKFKFYVNLYKNVWGQAILKYEFKVDIGNIKKEYSIYKEIINNYLH